MSNGTENWMRDWPQAVVSINAFKGVEFGLCLKLVTVKVAKSWMKFSGLKKTAILVSTNNLGGFEGGMTNGQPIVVRGVMKPIPTLYKPLMSVDIETHEPYKATVERSDPTALPAAGSGYGSCCGNGLATRNP